MQYMFYLVFLTRRHVLDERQISTNRTTEQWREGYCALFAKYVSITLYSISTFIIITAGELSSITLGEELILHYRNEYEVYGWGRT